MNVIIRFFSMGLIFFFSILCLLGRVNSTQALLAGVLLAIVLGHPWASLTKRATPLLLGVAIVGMGLGINIHKVIQISGNGFGITFLGILATVFLGRILGVFLKIPLNISTLTSVGTSICGGSAIAAISPVIKAKNHEISVSLGIVFLLNAVALAVFPFIGHYYHMTQSQFGIWAALAIHDTSSVVGAAAQFGDVALEIATTTKLTRALWIMPVALFFSFLDSQKNKNTKNIRLKIPWFIWGFVVASGISTGFPIFQNEILELVRISKNLLVLTLFFIGLGLDRHTLRAVGVMPFVHGTVLWIIVSSTFLYLIINGWIG